MPFRAEEADEGLLAESIEQLLEDNSLRERLSQGALRTSEKFSRSAICRQWASVMEEATNSRNRPPEVRSE